MKRKYEAPMTEVLRFDTISMLQQVSTKVDSGGATTGGRAPGMNFDAFDTSWDEEENSNVEV